MANSVPAIVVDEPQPREGWPYSGLLKIRGWVNIRKSGPLEISAAVAPYLQQVADVEMSRLDQKGLQPDLDLDNQCGFEVLIDTALLPNGRHRVDLSVHGIDGASTSFPVLIDHDAAFSSDYERWQEEFEKPDLATFEEHLPIEGPMIGVLFCGDSSKDLLARSTASLFAQSYSRFRLILPDASEQCDYIALVRPGDRLSRHALAFLAQRLSEDRCDLLYVDDDWITESDERQRPFFKPDWSPDLLASFNYIGRFCLLSLELARRIAPSLSALALMDCDERTLLATSHAQRIGHVPRVLYHQDLATYTLPEMKERRIRLDTPPCVSIIIASGGRSEILNNNLRSIFEKSTYPNYEIVVADNSTGEAIGELVRSFRDRRMRYFDWRRHRYNFSEINNEAAKTCQSEILLFLNDDVEVLTPDWLERMAEQLSRPEIGATGAKLLYPNGKIQHAGLVLGINETCGHVFKGYRVDEPEFFQLPNATRNISAVTGACLMTKADVFRRVGGFDATYFPINFSDVDLCLRIGQLGLRNLYVAGAVLTHHEAYSRRRENLLPSAREVADFRRRYRNIVDSDPYYNRNLTLAAEDFGLKRLSGNEPLTLQKF